MCTYNISPDLILLLPRYQLDRNSKDMQTMPGFYGPLGLWCPERTGASLCCQGAASVESM